MMTSAAHTIGAPKWRIEGLGVATPPPPPNFGEGIEPT